MQLSKFQLKRKVYCDELLTDIKTVDYQQLFIYSYLNFILLRVVVSDIRQKN